MSLLELNDISVRFGGNLAVSDVSLAVEPSSITGLIGPNGAGKTTIFNVITGLQPASGGRVRFADKDVTPLRSHRRARLGIARTFQRLEIFGSLTARENVLVAAEIRRRWARERGNDLNEEVDGLLDVVGIGDIGAERADSLPTGTARLIELARALALRPKLLLLDEPASGLDETETDEFADLLRWLAEQGIAILLVEHDVPLVMKVCSTIHVLDFGSILASGSAEEIQSDKKVLDAYLGQGLEAEREAS